MILATCISAHVNDTAPRHIVFHIHVSGILPLESKSVSFFFYLRLDHAEPDYVDEICPWNGDDCVVYRTTLAPTTTKAPTPKPEPSPEPNPEPTAEPEKQTTIKYVINCKSREIRFRLQL